MVKVTIVKLAKAVLEGRASLGRGMSITQLVGQLAVKYTLADLCPAKPCTVPFCPVQSCMVPYGLIWSPMFSKGPL